MRRWGRTGSRTGSPRRPAHTRRRRAGIGTANWFTVRLAQPPKFLLALAIIAIQGSVQAVVYLVGMKIFSESTPVEVLPFLRAFSLVGSIFGFVTTILAWVLVTHIIHTVALLFGADGSWRRTMEFIAFCQVPAVVGSMISAGVTVALLSQMAHLPPEQAMNALFSNYVHALGKTAAQVGFLVSVIGAAQAVQANYRLSPWRAKIAVTVPVVALLLVGQMLSGMAPKA